MMVCEPVERISTSMAVSAPRLSTVRELSVSIALVPLPLPLPFRCPFAAFSGLLRAGALLRKWPGSSETSGFLLVTPAGLARPWPPPPDPPDLRRGPTRLPGPLSEVASPPCPGAFALVCPPPRSGPGRTPPPPAHQDAPYCSRATSVPLSHPAGHHQPAREKAIPRSPPPGRVRSPRQDLLERLCAGGDGRDQCGRRPGRPRTPRGWAR